MSMRVVYTLFDKLLRDPARIANAQKATLDASRPLFGLSGVHGLYGSKEWWENIYNGTIPRREVSGIIVELVFAGMDSRWGDEVNTFLLKLDDGSIVHESIYTNAKPDERLFRIGARVKIVYVLLERRKQPAPDGGVNYSNTVFEMAVSAP